jgi:hypothetical protein
MCSIAVKNAAARGNHDSWSVVASHKCIGAAYIALQSIRVRNMFFEGQIRGLSIAKAVWTEIGITRGFFTSSFFHSNGMFCKGHFDERLGRRIKSGHFVDFLLKLKDLDFRFRKFLELQGYALLQRREELILFRKDLLDFYQLLISDHHSGRDYYGSTAFAQSRGLANGFVGFDGAFDQAGDIQRVFQGDPEINASDFHDDTPDNDDLDSDTHNHESPWFRKSDDAA